MIPWFLDKPLAAGAVLLLLMVGDWVLTVLQEKERQSHYAEHYESYPVNTIEGNPALQEAVRRRRILEPRHFLPAVFLGALAVLALYLIPIEDREFLIGFFWGIYLIVILTHLGNLFGYRASRRGLHGKLRMHLRTGYLVQMGRYFALALFLIVLAVFSASAFVTGVAFAGVVSAARQLLWLRRMPRLTVDEESGQQK